MADEVDSGIDKQKILSEIGASAPLPAGPAPAPPPPAAPPHASPPPLPPSSVPATSPAPPVAEARPRASRGRFARHRRQVAAIVMVFVALPWISVGIATHAWLPLALGATFLGLAILVGVGSLLRG